MKFEGVNLDWTEEFNGAITVCDASGIIVYMNAFSVQQFEKYGGSKLIGSNLLDCHPEPSKSKLAEMLKNPIDNMYTTEKKGVKTIIYQTLWKVNGIYKGLVEISFNVDSKMPHFVRD